MLNVQIILDNAKAIFFADKFHLADAESGHERIQVTARGERGNAGIIDGLFNECKGERNKEDGAIFEEAREVKDSF